jgi:HK97 gp10 family phage protein
MAREAFELGVRNLDALVANIHRYDQVVQQEARQLVTETADDIRDLTYLLAPKDTYYMADHVRIWISPSGLGFEVGWSADDFYGIGVEFYPWFQEYGTLRMQAQPSLTPAYAHHMPEFKTRLGDILRAAHARARQVSS